MRFKSWDDALSVGSSVELDIRFLISDFRLGSVQVESRTWNESDGAIEGRTLAAWLSILDENH
jgi:hypothetical protein